jgi:hypothetical protein
MCAGFTTVLGAILGIGLLTSCGHPVPPQLVRDGAGLFSADARSAAEARLRDLAIESGVWAFVISDPDGDPPRMLDAPMAEADARGVPAVAILFGPIGIVGGGHSDGSVEWATRRRLRDPAWTASSHAEMPMRHSPSWSITSWPGFAPAHRSRVHRPSSKSLALRARLRLDGWTRDHRPVGHMWYTSPGGYHIW